MGNADAEHVPVLLAETVALLTPPRRGLVVDATGGGGGHARALGGRLGPEGRLIVLDRDPDAVAYLRRSLRNLPAPVTVVRADFRDLRRVLDDLGLGGVDRLLADLGVSSRQLADPARGFSFQRPGPLDMRFDPAHGSRAADLVNRADPAELERLLRQYGQEPAARRIAAAIVAARPIQDTVTLAEVVRRAVGRRRGRVDPATRTFQALRIAVNDELGALAAFLPQGLDLLKPGGRMAVIAFHSLEDRLVKDAFRARVSGGGYRWLTPKPVRPGAEEVARNPRSRSARLRAVERVAAAGPPEGITGQEELEAP